MDTKTQALVHFVFFLSRTVQVYIFELWCPFLQIWRKHHTIHVASHTEILSLGTWATPQWRRTKLKKRVLYVFVDVSCSFEYFSDAGQTSFHLKRTVLLSTPNSYFTLSLSLSLSADLVQQGATQSDQAFLFYLFESTIWFTMIKTTGWKFKLWFKKRKLVLNQPNAQINELAIFDVIWIVTSRTRSAKWTEFYVK